MSSSSGTSYQGHANANNEITFFLNTQLRKRVSKKYNIHCQGGFSQAAPLRHFWYQHFGVAFWQYVLFKA